MCQFENEIIIVLLNFPGQTFRSDGAFVSMTIISINISPFQGFILSAPEELNIYRTN